MFLSVFQIIANSIQVGDDDALLKCLVDLAESCPKFLRPQVETILQLAIKVTKFIKVMEQVV